MLARRKGSTHCPAALAGVRVSIFYVFIHHSRNKRAQVDCSKALVLIWLLLVVLSLITPILCQSPHSLSREEFSPVIHPSCGRLHGQLKKNRLACPKRANHMLQHDLPFALPSSPLGPHLCGVRGHGVCRFFITGAGRKT